MQVQKTRRECGIAVWMGAIGLVCTAPAVWADRPGSAGPRGIVVTAWAVDQGTVALTLDPQALREAGLTPLPGEGTAHNFALFQIDPTGSEATVQRANGEVLRLSGYLSTDGQLSARIETGPLAGTVVALDDPLLSFHSRGAWVQDRGDLHRPLFDVNAADFSDDGATGEDVLTLEADLVIAEPLAEEVLADPSLAGRVVGHLTLHGFGRVIDVDAPQTAEAAARSAATQRGGTPNGPDVIVSSIGSSLSLFGTVSGISGYAMTTVSCNLGDQDAIWIDCSAGPNCNQHPVIGQNMYRLKDGRFEQIGMSWLKHGFCAADAPSCGSPYEPNGSCDWLGTHATDTYGSNLNGSQPDLGPRSEVNPWTGEYPYPYILHWNQSGNAVFKRLQIHVDDINPSLNGGALYFGEGHYIPTDEQPLNRYNNVSWRRVTVGSPSGGSWTLNFTGSTVIQQAAINAWPANDTGVTLLNIDVPSDGRFVLGYKVSDLGGGQWHYEYALYNMNSDRAGQSFAVPIPPGVNVTNAGFHDVDYHSDEPYESTDWTSQFMGGVQAWVTDKFATNPNANALRWGTLYNFRFDADSPPTTGEIQIGLFKPGTPSLLAVNAAVPLAVPQCACDGDVDANSVVNAADIPDFVSMYMGLMSVDLCADLASPTGGPLDSADVDAFVDVVLAGPTCP